MKKKLLLCMFIIFALLCTNVYAVLTMDLSLVTTNTKVEPGTDLLVTVSLKSISETISSIEGYINVDETVIEEITKDIIVDKDGKIEVKSGNDAINTLSYAFNPSTTDADYDVIFNTKRENIENNDCFFVMDLDNDVNTSADILNLKFKVKSDASVKEVKDAVKVNCVVAYSADKSDKTEEISAALDINVVKDVDATEDDANKDDNANKDDDTNKDDNTNKDNDTNKDDSTNKDNNANKDDNTNKDNDANKDNNTNKDNNANKDDSTNKDNNQTTNTNKDATVAATKIPAAGASLIILPIIVLAIVAYVSYKGYIKYKDI